MKPALLLPSCSFVTRSGASPSVLGSLGSLCPSLICAVGSGRVADELRATLSCWQFLQIFMHLFTAKQPDKLPTVNFLDRTRGDVVYVFVTPES